MSTLRLISTSFLFILIAFLTIGGCGGGGDGDGDFAGETNCSDMIDNDGDGEIDCEDIDCSLDPACTTPTPTPTPTPSPTPTPTPACDEIVDIICDRADECGFVLVDECLPDYVFNNLGFDCEDFLAGPFTDECMEDMDDWGYTFRLGSAKKWFEDDAEDARSWLVERNLLNQTVEEI